MAVTLAKDLQEIFALALEEARMRRHEFVTLEHVLNAMTRNRAASMMLKALGADVKKLRNDLEEFFENNLEKLPEDPDREPEHTAAFRRVLQEAASHVQSSGRQEIEPGDILAAIFHQPGSHAAWLLQQHGASRLDVLNYIAHGVAKGDGRARPAAETNGMAITGDDEEGGESDESPLEKYTVNLNERAQKGFIDPLIGRAAELQRTMQVLCRRRRNNPVFVGEPGVGKTAIVEGLALAIHEKKVPKLLENAVIYSVDMGAMLAGTKFRGQFEERLKGVVDAVKDDPNAILFIDEIHTIVGAGATSGGSMDASNLLKPALSSGEIRVIGSTTFKEYKASFERDRALERRFQRIDVLEPSVEDTVKILEGLRSRYEAHHTVKYTDEALRAAAELSAKYINDRQLPDKAIDVLDEAGAVERLLPEDQRHKELGAHEIEAVISRIARIPAKTVSVNDESNLKNLEPELKKMIYGQDSAVEALASAIKLSRSGLGSPDKPIGSFLFSGPTGVGKTELAKQLARVLGVEFLRFDMTEYMEKHTVSRLIGAPPGYVGYDQGGLLTDAIRKTPYAVLVLDEIEKAHPDVFNILLQVMDHATLTDNYGRKADFRHVVIILTTNAGAREMAAGNIGFGAPMGETTMAAAQNAKQAIERTFSPEFRNRLDAWIMFGSLPPEVILKIVDKFVKELEDQLKEKKVALKLTPKAREWLAEKGFDKRYGARPMGRLIQNEVKKPLAEAILFGTLKNGGTAVVDADGEKLKVSAEQ